MCIDKSEEKKTEPIIFLNTPITEVEKDAIGIVASVESIKMAIEKDAKMIGVIAEYGTGKSSLTELLAKSGKYKNIIRVNMWDSIKELSSNGEGISNLTKSFIYQLALGKSKKVANYVNKILNNNYGVISFSVGYKRTWFFLTLAGICATIYFVFNNIDIKNFVYIFGIEYIQQGLLLSWLAPVSGMISIVFAALGIYYSSFVFSYWKESNKRQTGINEVFAAYSYVYDLLMDRSKPTLVIVDDLDRIEDKEMILEFLKELYRFNNLCCKSKKKKPVFVVSVAPEVKIGNKSVNKQSKLKESSWVYPKIFDYIVSLKPVHYDDYRNVISKIIESEPEKKKKLNELLPLNEQIKDKDLPEAFTWLFKGENLTLRELKERLNQAISLLIDLRNKEYDGSPSISFKTCICVTYLERAYPDNYYEILEKEKQFSKLIQNAYVWRNAENQNDVSMIKKQIDEVFSALDINQDLAILIYEGVIDTDYRMYFYSFPKGSYIKDVDEKDICNYLEFPRDYPYEENGLNEKMERLCEREKLIKVQESVNRIAKTEEIKNFPEIIFKNATLWSMACESNMDKCVASFNHILNWEEMPIAKCCATLKTVADFDLDLAEVFWDKYKERLYSESILLSNDAVIKMRMSLISVFSEKILEFAELFMDQNVPLISKEEIEAIGTATTAVQLVNTDKIGNNNYQNIQQLILIKQIDCDAIEKAMSVQRKIMNEVSFEDVALGVYGFVCINRIIDDEIFTALCTVVTWGGIEKNKIRDYVNILPVDKFTENYFKEINEMCFAKGLKEDILLGLQNRKLFTTALLNIDIQEDVDVLNEENVPAIIEACRIINETLPEYIPKIRNEIVKRNNGKILKEFEELYLDEYPIIELDELSEIDNFETALRMIDASKFSKENIKGYIDYINEERHEKTECFYIFEWLFNPKYKNVCVNKEVIAIAIDAFDFSKIIFNSMSDEEKKNVINILQKPLGLTNPDAAKQFMKTIKCLLQEFESQIVQTSGITSYISYVNEVNLVSDYTIENILKYPPKYGLNSVITQRLLEEEKYAYYIVGKVLYDEKLNFPMECVPNEEVLALYYDNSPIRNYLAESMEFLGIVMKERLYRKISIPCTKGMLTPFFELKQTSDFLKFVLDTLPTTEVKIYLKGLNEIAGEEDSIRISQILTQEKYINYIADDEVFKHVEFRLWDNVKAPGYKGAFTKKRNRFKASLKS